MTIANAWLMGWTNGSRDLYLGLATIIHCNSVNTIKQNSWLCGGT